MACMRGDVMTGTIAPSKRWPNPATRRPSRGGGAMRLSRLDLAIAPLQVGDVVAHDRHRVALAGELHVEDELAARAEHHLGADQIELPHAAEALVVHLCDPVAV